MRIDISHMRADFARVQKGKKSRHSVEDRIDPRVWQFDYLVLSALARDMAAMIGALEFSPDTSPVAIDVGSARSPYRAMLEARGVVLKTLDVSDEFSPDIVGTAEATGVSDHSIDLVLCTQVLEHTSAPWRVVEEFHRILKPGGVVLASAPHVWFYHPQPGDYWRFTQEGMLTLFEDRGFEVIELRLARGSAAAFMQILNFLAYGVLGRWGSPLYCMSNLLGLLLDRIFPDQLFSLNVSCHAKKRSS